jgi:hypothetical protein
MHEDQLDVDQQPVRKLALGHLVGEESCPVASTTCSNAPRTRGRTGIGAMARTRSC